jgi:hypothetical protein
MQSISQKGRSERPFFWYMTCNCIANKHQLTIWRIKSFPFLANAQAGESNYESLGYLECLGSLAARMPKVVREHEVLRVANDGRDPRMNGDRSIQDEPVEDGVRSRHCGNDAFDFDWQGKTLYRRVAHEVLALRLTLQNIALTMSIKGTRYGKEEHSDSKGQREQKINSQTSLLQAIGFSAHISSTSSKDRLHHCGQFCG